MAEILVALISGLVLLGSVLVWCGIAGKLRAGRSPVEYEPRRPVPWSGWDVLLLIASFILCDGLLDAIWNSRAVVLTLGHLLPGDQQLMRPAIIGTFRIIWLAPAWVYLILRARAGGTDLGLNPRHLVADVRLGLLTFLAAVLPVYGVQLFFVKGLGYESKHPLVKMMEEQPSVVAMVLTTLAAVIVAPLVEEFLFRVLLQGWLEKQVDRRPPTTVPEAELAASDAMAVEGARVELAAVEAVPNESAPGEMAPVELVVTEITSPRPSVAPIVVVSLLFGLMHMGHGPDGVALFILAMLMGYVYRQTHRIYPSLVTHFCVNSLAILALWQELSAHKG